MASAITVAVITFLLPIFKNLPLLFMNSGMRSYIPISSPWAYYKDLNGIIWLAFVIAFVVLCIRRREEQKREPSVFDFKKYSLYSGDLNPFFSTAFGKSWNVRKIETLLEPGLFFCAGLILSFLGFGLGILLIVSSIFYSLGYVASYYEGDNWVMDKIDKIILSEDMHDVFVKGRQKSDRGVRFDWLKPNSEGNREALFNSVTGAEDEPQADVV